MSQFVPRDKPPDPCILFEKVENERYALERYELLPKQGSIGKKATPVSPDFFSLAHTEVCLTKATPSLNLFGRKVLLDNRRQSELKDTPPTLGKRRRLEAPTNLVQIFTSCSVFTIFRNMKQWNRSQIKR
jgi:hypothetical protein